jgi:hypothetical protein
MKQIVILFVVLCALVLPAHSMAQTEAEMINAKDLRDYVVVPTLESMGEVFPGANSEHAVNLLIGTVFQESVFGDETRLKQVQGPALGIYQIEPATNQDTWDNYLAFREDRASWVRGLASQNCSDFDAELVTNLRYATAIARIKYWRSQFEWPEDAKDTYALGVIWNDHYNANPVHGFPEDFVKAFPDRELF